MEKRETAIPGPQTAAPTQPEIGEVLEGKVIKKDAVFGEIQEGDTNYRTMGWLGTTAIMIKCQIGLGVLSIPKVFDTLGLIPGVIMLLVIGGMTTWANWIVGLFKLRHPEVYGVDDVGSMLFGRLGFEIAGAGYVLYWTFTGGSAILSISIAFNALSDHGACTAVFVAVAAIIAMLFSSIQTLNRISWLAWLGAGCIITGVLIVTIAVGIQGHPPVTTPGVIPLSDYQLFRKPSFADAVSAISTLVLAYAGAPAFFNIIAEMRDPRDYNRALAICQTLITVVYIFCGVLIYYYCGSKVASPALGSAGILIKKISYGIALPGLCGSAVVLLHMPAKHIFMRLVRGTSHLTKHTLLHYVAWFGSTFSVCMVAYIIASAIPVFSGLVSLIGALFATSLSFQPMGCMWLYDNWETGKREKSMKWYLGVAWSIFMIISGFFLTIAGTYGSIVDIIDSYKQSGGSAAWSCANNDG